MVIKQKILKIIFFNQTGHKLPSHFLQMLVFIKKGIYKIQYKLIIFLKSLDKIISLERLTTN
jgi:hypothetical protein